MRTALLILSSIFLIFSAYFVFLWNTPTKTRLKIAITKASGSENYEKYKKWLHRVEPEADYIDLSQMELDSALVILEYCHGLLVTGGPDINPELYNKAADLDLCGKIDHQRDTLELRAIELAAMLKIPVLGICRGMQILNVANGGSLYSDIKTQFSDSILHSSMNDTVAMHKINTLAGSRLQIITGTSGVVNSYHHQAVRVLAPGFTACATSEDGLIEAMEKNEAPGHILAVQWHPERMDSSDVFSSHISAWFLNNAQRYKQQKNKRKLFSGN